MNASYVSLMVERYKQSCPMVNPDLELFFIDVGRTVLAAMAHYSDAPCNIVVKVYLSFSALVEFVDVDPQNHRIDKRFIRRMYSEYVLFLMLGFIFIVGSFVRMVFS